MGDQLKRREFIGLFGGAAASRALAAPARQAGKPPIIGFLGAGTPTSHGELFAALVRRLRELGWIEGSTVAIEVRWAEGGSTRAAAIAAEFVRLKVDIIVTSGTPMASEAKKATATIPIVFATASDPLGAGLIASLGRPGGNITGLSLQQADVATKRIELLHEAVPGLRKLAILANTGSPAAVLEMNEVRAAARTMNLEVTTVEIQRAEDIAPAFEALNTSAQALYVCVEALVNSNRARIHSLAMGARLPAIYNARAHVEAGSLMSYGPNQLELWRRAADYVDKILRGAKPADIPVQQPTKFDLVINLTTAKALGLKVSDTLLILAEVIE